MSKVEELLEKYNPEGVDNIPLWELTAWDKKFNAVDKSMQKKVIKYKYYLAKDLDALVDDTGDIRILYTNEKVAYTSQEKCKGNICEGEIVAIPWGGTPTVKYYNGKFVTGDNRIATSLDTKILNNKYLFYWMISQLGTIADFYRGAGIQHPSMISVLSMQIPLPHIKVQEEIVKILDSFTNLIDALNEELSLRQKQFEYYREKLISNNASKIKTLNELSLNCDKKRIPITEKDRNKGDYPYYGASGIIDYIDKYIFDGKYLLISEDGNNLLARTQPIAFLAEGKFWVNNHAHILLFEKDIVRKFVQIYINSIDLSPYITGGAQPKLNQKNLNLIQIPIPENNIESIVEKLDAFESLIASLKEEIALRQKQYEYYREKLLTFD